MNFVGTMFVALLFDIFLGAYSTRMFWSLLVIIWLSAGWREIQFSHCHKWGRLHQDRCDRQWTGISLQAPWWVESMYGYTISSLLCSLSSFSLPLSLSLSLSSFPPSPSTPPLQILNSCSRSILLGLATYGEGSLLRWHCHSSVRKA